MQSKKAFDRGEILSAIEHILAEREEGWLEAAQVILELFLGSNEELPYGLKMSEFFLTCFAGSKANVVLITRYPKGRSAVSIRAILCDPDSWKPHTLARLKLVDDTSLWGRSVHMLARLVAKLLTGLILPLARPGPDNVYVIEVEPDQLQRWTVVYTTSEELVPGMDLRKLERMY